MTGAAAANRRTDPLSHKIGLYKGKLFRSLWEYSFYRHLESLGVDVTRDVDYEPLALPYVVRGKRHNYHPDMVVREEGKPALLVEVKSERELQRKRGRLVRAAKFEAGLRHAVEHGMVFAVMTERHFPVQRYETAYADANVRWIRGLPPKGRKAGKRRGT